MTFSEIKKNEGRISGLVALERALPYGLRSKSKEFLLLVAPFVMVLLLSLQDELGLSINTLYAFMFFVVDTWLVIFMLDVFYNSHYFEGSRFTIPEWGIAQKNHAIPFEILEIVSHTHSGDLTRGFLESKAGKDIMFRLNVSPKHVQEFIHGTRASIYADSITIAEPVDLVSYASAVFSADASFARFLTNQDVTRGDYEEVSQWVAAIYERKKEAFRWWGRDALGRIRSIGKNWARGKTEILERYGGLVQPVNNEALFKKEIDDLETELTQDSNSSVLLVANEYRKLVAVTSGLSHRIQGGTVLPAIEHKKLFLLDMDIVASAAVVEGQFESLVIQLLNEAVRVGNVILVIKNFPTFVEESKKHEVQLVKILKPYLAVLQIVAFAEQKGYTSVLKTDEEILSMFKSIFVENEKLNIIIRALEDKTFEFERRSKMFYSYQALVAIAEIASLKFPNVDAETKALQIFDAIGPNIVKKRIEKILVKDVRKLT